MFEQKERSDSCDDKREKVAFMKLTLRSIGVGAKSFEVADKTSTARVLSLLPS